MIGFGPSLTTFRSNSPCPSKLAFFATADQLALFTSPVSVTVTVNRPRYGGCNEAREVNVVRNFRSGSLAERTLGTGLERITPMLVISSVACDFERAGGVKDSTLLRSGSETLKESLASGKKVEDDVGRW